jgi:hypothetical protein
MHLRVPTVVLALLLAAVPCAGLLAREQPPARPVPAGAKEPPPVPAGVEVLTRGPVHEAFASLAADPAPTKPVAKKPPKALDEMPPAEKPEGNVVWISGYWAYDDERDDFLWVSGVWRSPPPGKQWIAGYWREDGDKWQWVSGFWTAAAAADPGEEETAKQVTYLPQPPAAPEVAAPGRPPAADTFYVPGAWIWTGQSYAWRAGYWARVQPGYVWVPDHYRWTPTGYVYIPGYWDYAIARRGVMYAPVVVDPAVVTVGFYYTPAYAVSDTVVVDALFVRPAYCHYYFGDYYGPTYVALGFQSGYVYSRQRYDSIVVYEAWSHRDTPNWVGVQIDVYSGRSAGRLPVPPRTLVQQNTIIQQNITNVNVTNISNTTNVTRNVTNYNTAVVAPTAQVAAAKGVKTFTLDNNTRQQALQQASAVQQVAAQRTQTEAPLPPGAPRQARVASLSVPQAKPVQPGFVAPPAPRTTAASLPTPVRSSAPTAATSTPGTAGPAAASAAPRGNTTMTPGTAPRPATSQPGMPARTPPRPSTPPPAKRPPPKDSHSNTRSQ